MLVLLCFLLPLPTLAAVDNTNSRRAVDVTLPQHMLRLPAGNPTHRSVAHTTHVAHTVKLAQAPRHPSTTPKSPPQKPQPTTAGAAKVLDLNQIIGHTDAAGRADYNRKLSQQRAAAVAHYLQHHFAVNDHRLKPVASGYG